MLRSRAAALLLVACALAGAGCGGDSSPNPGSDGAPARPVLGQRVASETAAVSLGFPESATSNTTRVGGADAVADAAAVALAVHPSVTEQSRPAAVTLVDRADWAAAVSAAQLAGSGPRAPVLFSDEGELPPASAAALKRLAPTGAEEIGGAQVIRIGTSARPAGLRDTNLEGAGPASLARAIDALHTTAVGAPTAAVVVAPLDAPAFAMPAAGWAAKSGDPVLWARRDDLPADTVSAIRSRRRPRIYVLGPREAIGDRVLEQLGRLGTVRRVAGPDPVRNAIAFARFSDGDFGWGVTDPGHGLVIAAAGRPADAAAAAPLSASGTYGPLLLLDAAQGPPVALRDYLLDIQPGYESDPVRGVYNHAWLLGDAGTISVPTQSRIDSLLEIQPVDPSP